MARNKGVHKYVSIRHNRDGSKTKTITKSHRTMFGNTRSTTHSRRRGGNYASSGYTSEQWRKIIIWLAIGAAILGVVVCNSNNNPREITSIASQQSADVSTNNHE